ncbi:MAG: SMP-30/gluconolactonase/LRE family protein [Saprospiraceae bacterium]
MKIKFFYILGCLSLLYFGCNKNTSKASPKLPYIQVLEPDLLQIIDSNAQIETLENGFSWAEGPLWWEEEKALLFSDVPKNTVYKWTEGKKLETYLHPSGKTANNSEFNDSGSNGLAFDKDGKLILCMQGDRTLSRMLANPNKPTPDFERLTDEFAGKMYNSPNDLCVAKNGDIFFTDPTFGMKLLEKDPKRQMTYSGIFLLKADSSIHLIDSTLWRPNGIALSPDETKLYVSNSDPTNAMWMEYTLTSQKRVISKKIFAKAVIDLERAKGYPDGLKVHSHGYVFATGPRGILIFNTLGIQLGTIVTKEVATNCAFSKDEKTLFVTQHKSVLRIPLIKK